MSDVFRRIVASSMCVQLTFLGMTLQGCAARQATTALSAKEFLTGTQSKELQRMVDARREIMFMPAKSDLMVQTSGFEQMKKELAPISAAANKEEMRRPSLKITREEGCEPPARLEYKPGQPIETLCSAPTRTVNGARSE